MERAVVTSWIPTGNNGTHPLEDITATHGWRTGAYKAFSLAISGGLQTFSSRIEE